MIELTTEDIQQLHDDMIAEHGGVPGTKDPGRLDFIAQQPFEVIFGQETYPDLFSKAAAYLVLIARSHMFFDANKRTAAFACHVFLLRNGWSIRMPEFLYERIVLEAAQGKRTIDEVAEALRKWGRELK